MKILDLFRKGAAATGAARSRTRVGSIPEGQRVYAIGDVHGCLDHALELARAIESDDAQRGPADTTVIFLGDLIDRGPSSATMLEFVRQWSKERRVRVLMGNHEEMFLQSFDELEVFAYFMRYGGRETVLSYPIDARAFAGADLVEAHAMMRAAVPQADREFIADFEHRIVIGDYAFVHAGIRLGIGIEQQLLTDLHWMREPFLSHDAPLDHIVVHGHTITDAPDFRNSRIGIDTGAFATGRLTALALEGDQRWFLEAATQDDGSIATRSFGFPEG
ncbi:metallophosphoesterase [Novosphingobium aquimarinum]|uniref:metallophosphoesterase n=1 Tax=Novosphingobium aquimarinum TaxID=2682494 RepID=UPI0012EB533B|nr:metallophosphoesterase [Novosphingobium aquimarinum]